jgi:hypothetical protein
VLLDAGAGSAWVYTEPETGEKYSRSEGLGVAAVLMFARGLFSSIPDQPYRVDAAALARLTPAALAEAFQVTEANPMVGLEGRAGLLVRLAEALKGAPEFFGSEARPGGIVGASHPSIIPHPSSLIPHSSPPLYSADEMRR